MKTIHKLKNLFAALFLALSLNSCDFLNVSDELASELSTKEVFENAAFTRRFHRGIYTGIPNTSFIMIDASYAACDGLGNPWPSSCDELKVAANNTKELQTTGYHAGNASLTRWHLYKHIRQANLFMENAHVVQSEKDELGDTELASLMAEARFLRAYYHFLLFELYGPIPVMKSSIESNSGNFDFARNSVDEVMEFLDIELKEVADQLKDEEPRERQAVPTKGTALAIRAKAWVYAASPLLNGGYREAVELRDKESKQLFPEKNDAKWGTALAAMEDFLEFAEGRFSLYKTTKKVDGADVYDADASLYGLFQDYNEEIIWASTKDSWGGAGGDGTQRRCTPRGMSKGSVGMSSIGVTQELVDAFFMKDGLSIQESGLYDETDFTDVTTVMDVFGVKTTFKDNIFNMYLNREPRFYQAVYYQGRRWQIGGEKIAFDKGGKDDNTSANNCYTGYLLHKRVNKTIYDTGNYPRSYFHPSILYRLAEFYLLYAEVLNEVRPSDTKIVEYVDKIRERAGIPLLKDIKSGIIGNQELQRKAIRQEMRVELCTEGQRYFDVRRWMIAENVNAEDGGQGGNFHGMNMAVSAANGFHTRTAFEKRTFKREMYLYPIPLTEIMNSKKLVQNPGW